MYEVTLIGKQDRLETNGKTQTNFTNSKTATSHIHILLINIKKSVMSIKI